MGRRPNEVGGSTFWILVSALLVSCALAYLVLTTVFGPPDFIYSGRVVREGRGVGCGGEDCCRGQENLEFWGPTVKWGTDHKFNSSKECCRACKAMCNGDGACLCHSWVFCGDRERCGEKFGECWLKKQEDVLFPSVHASGEKVIWTSGLIFGKGEGIVGLETDYGTIRIKSGFHRGKDGNINESSWLSINESSWLGKPTRFIDVSILSTLLPDLAPYSVANILELLGSRHCAGCHFYRAEGRSRSWDTEGNHIAYASFGPPYALIQGTLAIEGVTFKELPMEVSSTIKRGSVAWVDSGPEFFISLANHDEWRKEYVVFGTVLPEDMDVAEKIAGLQTYSDVWNNINVKVLKIPVKLKLKPIRNLGANES